MKNPVKDFRVGLGITRESLARALDISTSTLEKYESEMPMELAQRLADFAADHGNAPVGQALLKEMMRRGQSNGVSQNYIRNESAILPTELPEYYSDLPSAVIEILRTLVDLWNQGHRSEVQGLAAFISLARTADDAQKSGSGTAEQQDAARRQVGVDFEDGPPKQKSDPRVREAEAIGRRYFKGAGNPRRVEGGEGKAKTGTE